MVQIMSGRCPNCGEKRRRCLCAKRLTHRVFWIGLVILLIGGGVWAMVEFRKSEDRELREKFRTTLKQYLRSHETKDSWWLEQSPTALIPVELVAPLEQHKQYLQTVIERYQGVNDLTKAIAASFQNRYLSVYQHGRSVGIAPSDMVQTKPDIEICFLPADTFKDHPATMYYRREWQALMIAGIDFPEAVFPGFLFHELGHGYADRQKWPSANTTSQNDLWISEEVQMHELELVLWNEATKGAFAQALNEILARKAYRTATEAALSIRLVDFQKLDKVLGCGTIGTRLAGLMCAEYPTAVGFWFIERQKLDGTAHRAQQIELYKQINSFMDL